MPFGEAQVHYRGGLTDSSRWQHFVSQPGDIFICTPPKHGTTWLQSIVTFLVYQTANLDFIPAERAPWFDSTLESLEKSLSILAQNPRRHILKTHTPLDGIPSAEDAVYFALYRDPRDAYISMYHHNLNRQGYLPQQDLATGFWHWLKAEFKPEGFNNSLAATLHHFKIAWALRHRSNLCCLHYADLLRDLRTQMQQIAQILALDLSSELLNDLSQAARFESMKANYARYVPLQHRHYWRDAQAFFKQGGTGQGQQCLPTSALTYFEARLQESLSPEQIQWLKSGTKT